MSDNIIKFQRPKPVKPPRKSPFKNMAPGVKRMLLWVAIIAGLVLAFLYFQFAGSPPPGV